MKIFFDMDGVLAKWQWVGPDTLALPGYFKGLAPDESAVKAAKTLAAQASTEVYVLSAVMNDAAEKEKNEWLDKYVPFVPKQNRIFVPYGTDKSTILPEGETDQCILVDDFNPNLFQWKGLPIKYLNGINGSSGKWDGFTVSHDSNPTIIAASILAFAGWVG